MESSEVMPEQARSRDTLEGLAGNFLVPMDLPAQYQGVSLTPQKFQELMSYAGAMQEVQRRSAEMSHLPALTSGEDLSVGTLYRVAQDVGIDSRFVTKTLEIFHPSVERKVRTLDELGAHPTGKVVSDIYFDRFSSVLQNKVPGTNLRVRRGDGYHILVSPAIEIVKTKRKLFFGKREVKKVEYGYPIGSVVVLPFVGNSVKITIINPQFAEIFGDCIQEIKREVVDSWLSSPNLYFVVNDYNPFR